MNIEVAEEFSKFNLLSLPIQLALNFILKFRGRIRANYRYKHKDKAFFWK